MLEAISRVIEDNITILVLISTVGALASAVSAYLAMARLRRIEDQLRTKDGTIQRLPNEEDRQGDVESGGSSDDE